MFCPRCGQEQANLDVHYCSRCGLRVSLVRDLLNANGALESSPNVIKRKEWFFRQPKYRMGVKIIFAGIVNFPIALIIALANDAPEIFLLPFALFFLGGMFLIYRRLFGYEPKRVAAPAAFNTTYAPNYLNPPSLFSTPLGDSPVKTAEIVPVPSVTENTTRKLE